MDKKVTPDQYSAKIKKQKKNHAIQNFIYQHHTGKTVNCIQGSV